MLEFITSKYTKKKKKINKNTHKSQTKKLEEKSKT